MAKPRPIAKSVSPGTWTRPDGNGPSPGPRRRRNSEARSGAQGRLWLLSPARCSAPAPPWRSCAPNAGSAAGRLHHRHAHCGNRSGRLGPVDRRGSPGPDPALFDARAADKWHVHVPGGENYAEVAARATDWVTEPYHRHIRGQPWRTHPHSARAVSGPGLAGHERAGRAPGRGFPRAGRRGGAAGLRPVFALSGERSRLNSSGLAARPILELPCRTTVSAIFSASPPLAKATGRRSAAWWMAARPASR